MGYYHGYKGYRFIGDVGNKIPYTKFDEVVAVYNFDANLKSIFYPKLMLIETAVKNYTLEVLVDLGPVDFEYVFTHLLNDYKKEPVGNRKYRDKLKQRLSLRNKIYEGIHYGYSDKRAVIQHFFHSNKPIPLWAIFEVISLGEFGKFIQCMNQETRIKVTEFIGLHSTAHNQNGRNLEDIIFLIKELRNAVAHNSVVFDCRFKNTNQPARLKEYIQKETNIPNITFNTISDYLIIIVLLLKKLGIPKRNMKSFVKQVIQESEQLRQEIPIPIHTSIMGSDFRTKMEKLYKFI